MLENFQKRLIERRIKKLIQRNERYLVWIKKVDGFRRNNALKIAFYEAKSNHQVLSIPNPTKKEPEVNKETEEDKKKEKEFFDELNRIGENSSNHQKEKGKNKNPKS